MLNDNNILDVYAPTVKRPFRTPHFNGTLLDEHFHAEGRETWLETIEEMPAVFDAYLGGHIAKRPHRGPGMRTPAKTFHDGISRSSRKEGESNPKIAA